MFNDTHQFFTDPNGDPITLTFSGGPSGVVFADLGGGLGSINGTPTSGFSPWTVTVTASDSINAPVSEVFNLVCDIDDNPIICPAGHIVTGFVGTPLAANTSGQITGGVPPYTITESSGFGPNPDTGLSVLAGADTWSIVGTPLVAATINYRVLVQDTEGRNMECGFGQFIIENPPTPPEGPDTADIDCVQLSLLNWVSPLFTDINGDTLTFAPDADIPSWMTLADNGDNSFTLSGTPPTDGTETFTVDVNDGTGLSHTISITVNCESTQPVSLGCPDQFDNANSVNFDPVPYFTDAGNDIVTFEIVDGLPPNNPPQPPLQFDILTNSFTGSVLPGVYDTTVRATDEHGLFAECSFTWTIG